MSTGYIEHLKELFCDIHEGVMKNLRETDKEYSELVRNNIEESIKIREILKSLNDEDRAFILRNKDCTGRLEWIERETIYFQGYKDCIKLMNILELI
ncbi:hypothetical protein [Maledivibacter halophilus]|uniref:Uncharacterized protein n=1 Tax=Maledivibacter halophilus TaxID=36842 RepID=A0A1T5LNT5_9FIRM|nr:hypothetical protein [Maledivibacter halophilus]SKC77209.1 hypothetical protein SAMN02194393_03108 [Maledivibacter halophilus]SKC84622.1 hypothetical protein SAMN02194393_04187 [Maledivibacter halophilus]